LKWAIALLSNGNPVNIPEPGGGCYGNVNELGDVGRSPGKSFLFFLTADHPESGLSGDMVPLLGKHGNSCGVRCASDGP
jgi:hypothetical protein